MPKVARKDGVDSINTNHGCDATTVTDEGSTKVFVQGIGVVRADDKCSVHLLPAGLACVPHQVSLSIYSSKVKADGKGVGRIGDYYNGHQITSGSDKVYAG